jgi:hypothetical protein
MVVGQRSPMVCRVLAIGAFVTAGLLGAAANAQTQQQFDWCNNESGAFAPDLNRGIENTACLPGFRPADTSTTIGTGKQYLCER